MKQKLKQTEIGKMDFIGTWRITKMSEWDNDYVNEEVKAFIKIDKSCQGEFHFGYVQCSTSGDFKKNGTDLVYDFTFEGSDECDPTNGDGWMKINQDGTAEGEIRFHMGDCSKFWTKRAK
ncbi:MAG: hypothetical protein AABX82_07555 [Nanoarchaeota archaeon]